MNKILYYPIVLLFFLCSSCGNFLEEYSQNSSYVESVDDLEELLLGEVYMKRNVNQVTSDGSLLYLHILADESREMPIPNTSYSVSPKIWEEMSGFFTYAENPFVNSIGTARADKDWALFYRRISVINSILIAAPDHVSDDEEIEAQRLRVTGECYYLRAWNYFMLANLYGAAYDKQNPNDGASVTLKLDPAVEDTKFGRANSGRVYEQIVEDLKSAIGLLEKGSVVDSKVHVTVAAANALLSRVYLYMEQYDLAVKAADAVKGYALYDMVNAYTPGSGTTFLTDAQPEVIYAQGNYGMNYIHAGTGAVNGSTPLSFSHSYVVSDELERLFDDNDARYSAFFTRSYGVEHLVCRKYHPLLQTSVVETDPITGTKVSPVISGQDLNEIGSVRYAEVVLNKAEAQACAGDAGATETIRQFLQTRYYTIPVIPVSKGELIEFIRQERYKELCFEGHRWFDLRRYAVNTVHPQAIAVEHVWHTATQTEATVAGSYILKGYDNTTKGSWMLPVPEDVINYCYPVLSNFDRLSGVTKN